MLWDNIKYFKTNIDAIPGEREATEQKKYLRKLFQEQEFSQINDRYQTTDPRNSQNTKQDKH